jgi:hypothetical protein
MIDLILRNARIAGQDGLTPTPSTWSPRVLTVMRDARHEHRPPPVLTTATAVLSRPSATGS